MIKNNFFTNLIGVIFFFTSTTLTLICLFLYPGNKLIYLLFSLIFNLYLIYSIKKEAFFFDFFFSILLWLGFWFKFSIQMIFLKNRFPEGVGSFDFKSSSFDDVLMICIFSQLSLVILSYVIRNYVFNYSFVNFKTKNLPKLNHINNKKALIISLLFILCFTILYIFNHYFSIYQKGIHYEGNLNFIIYNLIVWLIKIGLPAIVSIIVYYSLLLDFKPYRVKSFYISILESFFSSISQISRAMIFNPFSILFGVYKLNQYKKNIYSQNDLKRMFFYLITFFLISLFVSSELRNKFYNLENKDNLDSNKMFEKKFTSHFSTIIRLAANRWVGIEGVMASYSLNEKSINFFLSSFKEKYSYSETFYETKVKKNEKVYKFDEVQNFYTKQDLKHIRIFTPGIIGFLLYSGSKVLVCLMISFIYIFCILLEFIIFKFSKNNLIFTSLMSNILAYHLIHFGYMPQNSYKVILGIFLGLIMIMTINKLFIKQ